MKQKQKHFRNASFTALLFVLLGYTVKFYPQQLEGIDLAIQTVVRGDLVPLATHFWTTITTLGNTLVLLSICLVLAAFFYRKKWKAESYFILISFVLIALFAVALKYLYQRPRPSIEWLIDTIGYSFPSWHAASTLMIAGAVAIVLFQRIKRQVLRVTAQIVTIALAVLVGVSRIYIGVHYPTDILGGWLLAITLLQVLYPLYDQQRFTWRFQSKQL